MKARNPTTTSQSMRWFGPRSWGLRQQSRPPSGGHRGFPEHPECPGSICPCRAAAAGWEHDRSPPLDPLRRHRRLLHRGDRRPRAAQRRRPPRVGGPRRRGAERPDRRLRLREPRHPRATAPADPRRADRAGARVEARPGTISAGGNDIIRPGTDPDDVAARFEVGIERLRRDGATVVMFNGPDIGGTPVLGRIRGKVAIYNENLRAVAQRHDAIVADMWALRELSDPRMWDADRLHFSPIGHHTIARMVLDALNVENDLEPFAPEPLPPSAGGRPGATTSSGRASTSGRGSCVGSADSRRATASSRSARCRAASTDRRRRRYQSPKIRPGCPIRHQPRDPRCRRRGRAAR